MFVFATVISSGQVRHTKRPPWTLSSSSGSTYSSLSKTMQTETKPTSSYEASEQPLRKRIITSTIAATLSPSHESSHHGGLQLVQASTFSVDLHSLFAFRPVVDNLLLLHAFWNHAHPSLSSLSSALWRKISKSSCLCSEALVLLWMSNGHML